MNNYLKNLYKVTAISMAVLWVLLYILLFMSSCCPGPRLHYTGAYVITARIGNVTEFQGIKGKYKIESDTLKIGDTIKINVVRLYSKN